MAHEYALSKSSVEHYTPVEVLLAARAVMGSIDIDPASRAGAAADHVGADVWFGPGSVSGEDGIAPDLLDKISHGNVFLNPPGGRTPKERRKYTLASGREISTGSNTVLWWHVWSTLWLMGRIDRLMFICFNLNFLQAAQGHGHISPLLVPLCIPARRLRFLKPTPAGGLEEGGSPVHANAVFCLPNTGKKDRQRMWKHVAQCALLEGFERHFSGLGEVRL